MCLEHCPETGDGLVMSAVCSDWGGSVLVFPDLRRTSYSGDEKTSLERANAWAGSPVESGRPARFSHLQARVLSGTHVTICQTLTHHANVASVMPKGLRNCSKDQKTSRFMNRGPCFHVWAPGESSFSINKSQHNRE